MRIELGAVELSSANIVAVVELVVLLLVVVIVVVKVLEPPVPVLATVPPDDDSWCCCCCCSDSMSGTRTTVGLDVRSVCRWICGIVAVAGVDGSSSESVFREEDGVR